jgi:hypothetical protein
MRHKTHTLAEFLRERPLVLAESISLDDSGQDSLQRPQARSGHTCEDVECAALLRGLPTCFYVFVVVGTKDYSVVKIRVLAGEETGGVTEPLTAVVRVAIA